MQDAFDVSDSEPTNPAARSLNDIERLLALFDAILSVPPASLVLWAGSHPNAEYALRLWAGAHGLRFECAEVDDTVVTHVLREDFSALVTVYAEVAS